MIHPVFIDHAEHHDALQFPHQRSTIRSRAECGLARRVGFLCNFQNSGCYLAAVCLSEILQLQGTARKKPAFKRLQRFVQLLLALGNHSAEPVGHGTGYELLDHPLNLFLQIFTIQHLLTLAVNDVPLLIHHIIVFKDALTGLEVPAFHRLLRLFDRTGQHLCVQRRVLFHLQGVHHTHDPLRAEQTHDIVRHRQIEPAFARIALTAGTAAQLVVNSA